MIAHHHPRGPVSRRLTITVGSGAAPYGWLKPPDRRSPISRYAPLAARQNLAVALVAVLATAACGSGGRSRKVAIAAGAAGGQPTTAPSASSPTAATMPLTGLAAPAGVPDRPVVAVKIDNAPPARPQAGLNAADLEDLWNGYRLFVSDDSERFK